MKITAEQKNVLKKYLPNLDEFKNLGDLLLALDDVITEVGFDENWELNSEGLKLQKIYDEIYMSNA